MVLPKSPRQSWEVQVSVASPLRARNVDSNIFLVDDGNVCFVDAVEAQPNYTCESIVTPEEDAKPEIDHPTRHLRVVQLCDVEVHSDEGEDRDGDVNEEEDFVDAFSNVHDRERDDER